MPLRCQKRLNRLRLFDDSGAGSEFHFNQVPQLFERTIRGLLQTLHRNMCLNTLQFLTTEVDFDICINLTQVPVAKVPTECAQTSATAPVVIGDKEASELMLP
ncbi:hypothetical protein DF054_26640 [Burkholderia cepacia]|nr:hypothetical protein DF055_25420 [Burkholderia cepacia]RRA03035.1 hypothetical protein DF054_26640 [Burkholderia cepacia]